MSIPNNKTAVGNGAPVALHQKAEENLQYIRNLMESSSSFTGVSGKGYVIAGIAALIAGWFAARQEDPVIWLQIWMLELAFAAAVTFTLTIHKARNQGESLWSTTGRKLLFAFIPPMFMGAILTVFLARQGAIDWLPGIWLGLYGAAVMTAGAYSVGVIRVMGALFMLLSVAVLLLNLSGDLILGLGMGGLHIVFGLFIWRHHGG